MATLGPGHGPTVTTRRRAGEHLVDVDPGGSGGTADRRTGAVLGAVAGVVALGLVAAWTAIALVDGAPLRLVVLPIAGLVGAALVAVSVRRVEALVLVALVVRASLDVTKLGAGTGGIEPSVGLGLLVTLVAVVVVAVPRDRDRWPGPAPFTQALLAVVAAGALSVVGADRPAAAALELARLGSTAAMLVLLDRLIVDGRMARRVLTVVFAAAVVPLLVATVQLAGFGGTRQIGGFERVRATFLHPNPFAIFCTVLLVAGIALVGVMTGWRRRALLGTLAALGVGLFATYARGAWIAAAAGVVAVAVAQRNRRLLVGLVVGVVAVVALVPSAAARFADVGDADQASGEPSNSLSWRLDYWQDALELADGNPLTGIGLDMVSVAFEEAVPPHNDYVRVVVELGVVGALAYLALLGTLAGVARRARQRATSPFGRAVADGQVGLVVVVVVLSLTANVLSQVVVMWYVVALTAVAVAVGRGVDPADGAAWAGRAGRDSSC